MSFLDQVALAENQEFVRRVQMAMVKSAVAVVAEDPATAHHATRAQWATQVLRDPEHYADRVAFGVVTNASITAESTDNDIEFTVNSQWNAYAGVVTQEAVT
ncbi:MAG: hypothetical protein GVY30_12180 [Chloroflexi bacterium]|jgi:hypothetical protein|nr:hypothetical protein [Chloroflexota bacterium]